MPRLLRDPCRADSVMNGRLDFKEKESQITKATRWERGCPFEGPELSSGSDSPGVSWAGGVGIPGTCQNAGSQARPQTGGVSGWAQRSLCP